MDQVEQVAQANSYCTHGKNRLSLFTQWKKKENYNKKTPVPLVPAVPVEAESLPIVTNIKPQSKWDACDHAVYAKANGLPLPPGWWCVDGVELAKIVEYEKITGQPG